MPRLSHDTRPLRLMRQATHPAKARDSNAIKAMRKSYEKNPEIYLERLYKLEAIESARRDKKLAASVSVASPAAVQSVEEDLEVETTDRLLRLADETLLEFTRGATDGQLVAG